MVVCAVKKLSLKLFKKLASLKRSFRRTRKISIGYFRKKGADEGDFIPNLCFLLQDRKKFLNSTDPSIAWQKIQNHVGGMGQIDKLVLRDLFVQFRKAGNITCTTFHVYSFHSLTRVASL